MKIALICVEDGLENIGFRKLSAYVKQIHDDTSILYFSTGNSRVSWRYLFMKEIPSQPADDIEAAGARLAQADIIGFSAMTQHSQIVIDIIGAIRRRNPKSYIVWGGIHAIVEPEDAIKHADAVCTGEGEFAFEAFLSAFKEGAPFTGTPGFWFNTPEGIVKNANPPLMTNEDMDRLPVPTYQNGEFIYKPRRGFVPITPMDFVKSAGLAYYVVWSIGCPFQCAYCGNSKFIDYDKGYRKIRHSSVPTIITELKEAVRKHPHISTFVFVDDSFMALRSDVLREFSEAYKKEIGLPFVVLGVFPTYVREDKIEMLIDAGMNRVRMGIQSGSQAILDFYDRPTSGDQIRKSCAVLNKFSRYILPPNFDIMLDNPVETTEDVIATLDLLYDMPRPYDLNIFSLRVIPNTRLANLIREKGVDMADIRSNSFLHEPTFANILLYAIALFKLPKSLYRHLRRKALPARVRQKRFTLLMYLFRAMYMAKRLLGHFRFMDFSLLPGWPGYLLWKIGLVRFWHKYMLPKMPADREARSAGLACGSKIDVIQT